MEFIYRGEYIEVITEDEKGAGGANHEYAILNTDNQQTLGRIKFQTGPILEAGVNGITNEALLEIVKHRLVCFQDGGFDCQENINSLLHINDALYWLYKRTADRKARGVEGLNIQ